MPAQARRAPAAARDDAGRSAALTVSRPELLVDGSDGHFRRLVHGLFAFFARHAEIREGHGAMIGLAGIEYTMLIAVRHLGSGGDVSVRDVAAHLRVSGAFATTITNKLLAKGLIGKDVDPRDRRRVRLSVTEHGDALLERLAPVQRQVNDVEFGCLSSPEFLQLLDVVDRLVQSSDRALGTQRYLAGAPASALPQAGR